MQTFTFKLSTFLPVIFNVISRRFSYSLLKNSIILVFYKEKLRIISLFEKWYFSIVLKHTNLIYKNYKT